jgi:outer membrane protein assembly factor BamB
VGLALASAVSGSTALAAGGDRAVPHEVIVESALMDAKMCPGLENSASIGPDGSLVGWSGKTRKTLKCGPQGVVWTAEIAAPPSAIGPSGSIFFTTYDGIPTIGEARGTDGATVWQSPVLDRKISEALNGKALDAPDGGAYFLGLTKGQLPGQPASARGQVALGRFDAAGKRVWLRQSADFGTVVSPTAGGIYVAAQQMGPSKPARNSFSKFRNDGSLEWTSPVDAFQILALAADKRGAAYLAATTAPGTAQTLVQKFTSKGKPLWKTPIPHKLESTIDAVEGVIQQGTLEMRSSPGSHVLFASANTLFYVTKLTNRYQNGSVQRAMHTDVAVFAFDATNGKRKWAKQYRVGPVAGPETRMSFKLVSARLLDSGNILLFGLMGKHPRDPAAFLISPSGAVVRKMEPISGATTTQTAEKSDAAKGTSSATAPATSGDEANLSKREKAKRWFKGESN